MPYTSKSVHELCIDKTSCKSEREGKKSRPPAEQTKDIYRTEQTSPDQA